MKRDSDIKFMKVYFRKCIRELHDVTCGEKIKTETSER